MQQQSSQIPQDEFEEGQLNNSMNINNFDQLNNSYDSPTIINLQRHSRISVKIKSISSSRSRSQLIKVCKVNQQPTQIQNGNDSQSISITGCSKRQCRICLEGQAQGRLVTPCKCIGSMQYAHEKCLSEWVKRKINFRQKGKVHCQVCDQPFEYKISKRLFVSCQSLRQNYQKHRSNYICFMIVMIVLIVLWLSMLSITCIGLSNNKQDNWVKKYIMTAQQTKIIFVCVIFVYLLIMLFVILLFVAEYGIKRQLFIKNVQNYTKKYKKIVPKLYSIAT